MKKTIKILIFSTLFLFCIGVIFLGLRNSNIKIILEETNGGNLPNNIQAMLCYSTGASGIEESETFFLNNNKLEESTEHYFLAYSHIFSDERITQRFAIPLGYKDGEEMVKELGQIFDYKNFEGVEVLILNNWYEENGKLIIMYNIENELKIAECDVGDATLLGTYLDKNEICIFLTFETEVILATVNINDNFCTTNSIPYTGLIRNRSDLLESNTFIRNGIVYFGEYTANYEKNEIYSTITSLNLEDGIINSLRFDNELLYHLSSNGNELVALFATDKDEIGYYQQINCKMIDFDLSICSSHFIQNLPENIDTMKIRDRSRIYDNILYTIIDGIYTNKNYLLAYDLQKRKIIYYASLENKMSNKVLFDWNFYIRRNNENYDIQ